MRRHRHCRRSFGRRCGHARASVSIVTAAVDRANCRSHKVNTAWDRYLSRRCAGISPTNHYCAGGAARKRHPTEQRGRHCHLRQWNDRSGRSARRRGWHPFDHDARVPRPEITPRYAGYFAWRGVIEESEMTAAEHALTLRPLCAFPCPKAMLLSRSACRGAMRICGRAIAVLLDLVPRSGWSASCPAWHRCGGPLSRQLDPAALDARPEVIRDLHAAEARCFAPPFVAIIRRSAFPIRRRSSMSRRRAWSSAARCCSAIGFRRAAACRRRHHQGGARCQRAGRGAGARAGCRTALARYDRERRAFGHALVARAQHLGAYLEAESKRRGGAERRPETVLQEYGTAGKIDGR